MTQQEQLQKLVRYVVREALNELMGSTVMGPYNQPTGEDPLNMGISPTELDPAEKSKLRQQQQLARSVQRKEIEADLTKVKARMAASKAQMDQDKRFTKPDLEKKRQALMNPSTESEPLSPLSMM